MIWMRGFLQICGTTSRKKTVPTQPSQRERKTEIDYKKTRSLRLDISSSLSFFEVYLSSHVLFPFLYIFEAV